MKFQLKLLPFFAIVLFLFLGSATSFAMPIHVKKQDKKTEQQVTKQKTKKHKVRKRSVKRGFGLFKFLKKKKLKKYKSKKKKKKGKRIHHDVWYSLLFTALGATPLVGAIFAAVGVLLGVLAIKRINKDKSKYKGTVLAIISIALGILGIIVGVVFAIAFGII